MYVKSEGKIMGLNPEARDSGSLPPHMQSSTRACEDATRNPRWGNLRFDIGDRVTVRRKKGVWLPGTVKALWYSEASWAGTGRMAPYQVQLDAGPLVYCPTDSEDAVRDVSGSKNKRAASVSSRQGSVAGSTGGRSMLHSSASARSIPRLRSPALSVRSGVSIQGGAGGRMNSSRSVTSLTQRNSARRNVGNMVLGSQGSERGGSVRGGGSQRGGNGGGDGGRVSAQAHQRNLAATERIRQDMAKMETSLRREQMLRAESDLRASKVERAMLRLLGGAGSIKGGGSTSGSRTRGRRRNDATQ